MPASTRFYEDVVGRTLERAVRRVGVVLGRRSWAVQRVESTRVDVFGPVDFDWMRARSYYFYDPNGNLLEFRSPDPDQAHPHVSRTAGV